MRRLGHDWFILAIVYALVLVGMYLLGYHFGVNSPDP